MKILAVETSCDETAAAVTEGTNILSSVKWTQEVHAKWGGVVPALAKRAHEEKIDGIVDAALRQAQCGFDEISAIAVTVGPGLAIALEVGISKAKELAHKYGKPLVGVNHIEGHILSALISAGNLKFEIRNLKFPCAALVVSGGHTQVIWVEKIGKYKILAQSLDDDIGEALDKGARLLGLPYPGGAELEKRAAKGNPKRYPLPLPMAGREKDSFSYSGLKTAFYRLVNSLSQSPSEKDKADLAASYQAMVFKHLVRITKKVLEKNPTEDLLVGGGVAANQELRERLRDLETEMGIKMHYPVNLMLCTDNAAMIGVAGGFKAERGEFADPDKIDRMPRWRVDDEGR